METICENDFLNFYFLNVHISVTMHNLYLKLHRCIEYIAVEGTMSQILDIGSSSFFIKFRKKYSHK